MKKLLLIIALVLFIPATSFAAGCTGTGNCYWVGGSGNANDTAHWATADGGSTTGGLPGAGDNCNFTSSSSTANAAYTFTVNAATTCLDFLMAGPGGGNRVTWAGSSTLAISGSSNLSGGTAGITRTYTGTITYNATTSKTITSNGVALDSSVTFNGVSGVWALADAFVTGATRTCTLTNGTFNSAGFAFTCGFFSSNNGNIRTIAFGLSQWTLNGASTNLITTSTATNLTVTYTDGAIINVTDASSAAKSMNLQAPGAAGTWPSVTFSGAGTGTFTLTNAGTMQNILVTNSAAAGFTLANTGTFNNITFTNYTGTWTQNNNGNVTGNVTLATGMTSAGNFILAFTRTSGTSIFTSNGVHFAGRINVNGVGGTLQFADAFVADGATGSVTLTNGTLDTNNVAMQSVTFVTAAGTKTLTLGSTVWTIPTTGTSWNIADTSNFTITANTAFIKMTNATSSTVLGGGVNWNGATFWASGTGAMRIASSNTLSIKADPGATVNFTASTTQTIVGWDVTGTSGSHITIQSTTAGTFASLTKTSGTITCTYCNIKDSHAGGGALWLTVASVNNGNNTGWVFPSGGALHITNCFQSWKHMTLCNDNRRNFF